MNNKKLQIKKGIKEIKEKKIKRKINKQLKNKKSIVIIKMMVLFLNSFFRKNKKQSLKVKIMIQKTQIITVKMMNKINKKN